MKENGFPKSARLHHRTLINNLFEKGNNLYGYPLRVIWHSVDEEELSNLFRHGVPDGISRLQMMVTVPKKKQRRAVDRVRLRRRIREAYRLQRQALSEVVENCEGIRNLSLAVLYISDKDSPYTQIAT